MMYGFIIYMRKVLSFSSLLSWGYSYNVKLRSIKEQLGTVRESPYVFSQKMEHDDSDRHLWYEEKARMYELWLESSLYWEMLCKWEV